MTLRNGRSQSCGCLIAETARRLRSKDLTGQRFGRLLVVELIKAEHPREWRCVCDCGVTIVKRHAYLTSGDARSCGCLFFEMLKGRRTHGESVRLGNTKEYRAWQHAKSRCYCVTDKSYPDYGGRGITMADEWRMDYKAFLRDMGRCPPGHSLERLDNAGPYMRGNCKWASRVEQNNNTRASRRLTFNGETRTLAQWAAVTGISTNTIRQRIKYYRWSVEQGLTTPTR